MIRLISFIFLSVVINVAIKSQDSLTGYWKKSQCFIDEMELKNSSMFQQDRLFVFISDTMDFNILKGYGDADSFYGLYSLNHSIFYPNKIVKADMFVHHDSELYSHFYSLVKDMFYYEFKNDTLWLDNNKIRISFIKPTQYEIDMVMINSSTIDDLNKRNNDKLEVLHYMIKRSETDYKDYNVTYDSDLSFKVEDKVLTQKEFIKWIEKENKRISKENTNTSMRISIDINDKKDSDIINLKLQLFHSISTIDELIIVNYE